MARRFFVIFENKIFLKKNSAEYQILHQLGPIFFRSQTPLCLLSWRWEEIFRNANIILFILFDYSIIILYINHCMRSCYICYIIHGRRREGILAPISRGSPPCKLIFCTKITYLSDFWAIFIDFSDPPGKNGWRRPWYNSC